MSPASHLGESQLEPRIDTASTPEEAANWALQMLQKATSAHGSAHLEVAAAHRHLGELMTSMDQWEAAIHHYYNALVIAAGSTIEDHQTVYLTGAIRIELESILIQNDPHDDLESINKALGGALCSAQRLTERGQELEQFDLQASLAAYSEALRLFPAYDTALRSRAGVRFLLGDLNSALSDVNLALVINPSDVASLKIRASILLALGKTGPALIDCCKALTLQPNDLGLLRQRAETWMAQKEWARAEEDIETLLALEPQEPFHSILHNRLRREQGKARATTELGPLPALMAS